MLKVMDIVAIILSLFIVIILLIILTKMFYKQWRFGVPFIRSKNQWIQSLLEHLNMKAWEVFLDLWCGDGIVMAAVLDRFPWVKTRGYEILPKVCKLWDEFKKKYWNNFELINDDYFKADFSDTSVVYAYLLPRLIRPVWEKIKKECKPWTLFYSYVFVLPDVEPLEKIIVPVPGRKDDVLHVYIV